MINVELFFDSPILSQMSGIIVKNLSKYQVETHQIHTKFRLLNNLWVAYHEENEVIVMKKILIVEDNNMFRETLCEVLNDDYSITGAENGKIATELLSLADYDLVISDVQMPSLSGVELLEWSLKHKPTPFIIMTGFSTLLETQSAFDLGASGFLTKPFKIEDLRQTIQSILKESKADANIPPGLTSNDFCKVQINEFLSKPIIDFDLYIKLSDVNFVKIANRNDQLPKDQIRNYNARGIQHLHILKSDFRKLVQFNLEIVKIAKDRENIPHPKKLSLLKNTANLILETSYSQQIDRETFKDSAEFLQLAVETVNESDEAFQLMDLLSTHSNQVFSHSLVVSMYSILIAKQLGIESNLTLFKISMAGLFHDIGKKEIDQALLNKPRHLVSKDERMHIESHVTRGYEILLSIKNMHSDVTRMVLEHHEDQAGTGYPMHKHSRDQHPLSRIIQCANIFVDNLSMLQNDSSRHAEPLEVLNHIESIYGPRIDPACMAVLKKLFSRTEKKAS